MKRYIIILINYFIFTNFFFMKNLFSHWFTLIELLVVIAIISILALWINSINWNSLSDRQKISIFNNKIMSNIESIRNNALVWRWVWNSLLVPKKWKIDFSPAPNSWVKVSYLNEEDYWISYNSLNIFPKKFYSIKSLKCLDLRENLSQTWEILSQTWTIEIQSGKMSLFWCPSKYHKKLKIVSGYKWFEESFSINVVSWLIERE